MQPPCPRHWKAGEPAVSVCHHVPAGEDTWEAAVHVYGRGPKIAYLRHEQYTYVIINSCSKDIGQKIRFSKKNPSFIQVRI